MQRSVGTCDGGAVANQTVDHAAHPSQRGGSISAFSGFTGWLLLLNSGPLTTK